MIKYAGKQHQEYEQWHILRVGLESVLKEYQDSPIRSSLNAYYITLLKDGKLLPEELEDREKPRYKASNSIKAIITMLERARENAEQAQKHASSPVR
jgi:hypothetical protein